MVIFYLPFCQKSYSIVEDSFPFGIDRYYEKRIHKAGYHVTGFYFINRDFQNRGYFSYLKKWTPEFYRYDMFGNIYLGNF
ncbi:MAG: hypothetical protein J0I88_09450 [Chryseobacterium sp.]|nr:hypothetical protein [Chryseobacterium sp.]